VRVIFLGTGGSLPSPKRNVTAVAVQIGADIVLFDCGEGTQRQFMLSKASFMKVNAVFITHFHGDHFLGLPALLQSLNFSGRRRPLYIYGPPGMIDTVESILSLGYFAPGFDVIAREMEHGGCIEFSGYRVTAVAMDHTVPCLGYVLEEDPRPGRFDLQKARQLGIPAGPSYRILQEGHEIMMGERSITPDMVMGPPRKGRKIAISGDTRPSPAFAAAAREADLMVHEATLGAEMEKEAAQYGHTTARGAAEMALRSQVRTLFLYHISPRYEDAEPLLREAREVFPETYLAEDLAEVSVTTGPELKPIDPEADVENPR
jgi:ribonuclease Z